MNIYESVNQIITQNFNQPSFFLYESNQAFSLPREERDETILEMFQDFPDAEKLHQQAISSDIRNCTKGKLHRADLKRDLEVLTSNKTKAVQKEQVACFDALQHLNANHFTLDEALGLQNPILNAHDFTNWTLARNLCDDATINWNSKVLYNLNVRNLTPLSTSENDALDYDRLLLTHIFNEAIKNSSPAEKEAIIDIKAKFISENGNLKLKAQGVANKVSIAIEKIVNGIATILNSPAFKMAVGLGVCLGGAFAAWKVAHFIKDAALFYGLPLFINHAPAPLVHIVSAIYENVFAIWLSAFAISLVNPSTRLDKWVFSPIRTVASAVMSFPKFTIGLAFKIGYNAGRFVYGNSQNVGSSISLLQKKWTDMRLGHELVEARELWIDAYLRERQDYRAAAGAV